MEKNLYIQAYEQLASGRKLVLARTIKRSGSTPRDVGSMCIITEDETLIGTVGGGILEYRVQQKAAELLKTGTSFIYEFSLTESDLAKAGMICGGDVDLFLEVLSPENPETVSLFETLKNHITNKSSGMLVTRIADHISAMDIGARLFIDETGTAKGMIPGLDPEKINLKKDRPFDWIALDAPKLDLFVERIAMEPRVLLFGAGHVSVCVSKLAKMVGFHVTVVDDRAEFANPQRFPDADDFLITGFNQAFEKLAVSENTYILIITRGHLFDKVVLEQALSTCACYIGMIGSTRKRNTIYNALMAEGFSKEALEQVYSPIGLDIHAETPEEIAVSIVAELIQKRAPQKKKTALIL